MLNESQSVYIFCLTVLGTPFYPRALTIMHGILVVDIFDCQYPNTLFKL